MRLFKKKKREKKSNLGIQESVSSEDISSAASRWRTNTTAAVPPPSRPSFLPSAAAASSSTSSNVKRSNTTIGGGSGSSGSPNSAAAFLRSTNRTNSQASTTSSQFSSSPRGGGGGRRESRPLSLHLDSTSSSPLLLGSLDRRSSGEIPSHVAVRPSPPAVAAPPKPRTDEDDVRDASREETGREKAFHWAGAAPPIIVAPAPESRTLKIQRREQGGFGFTLRQPGAGNQDVHLLEPKEGVHTGVMSGDRLLAVNGQNVKGMPHGRVVELIKSSTANLTLSVVSVQELAELSRRGVLDVTSSYRQEAGKQVIEVRQGTLRKIGAKSKKVIGEDLDSEASRGQAEKLWLVHQEGFSAANVVKETKLGMKRTPSGGFDLDEKCKIQIGNAMQIVDGEDLEKANPPQFNLAEDLASLFYLNESSILHTLRQRLGNGLIHTHAGPHMVIINPGSAMPIYSDKISQVFRGCRKEDMPPHAFAAAQVAYNNMLTKRNDQSLITMGISGSGKTYCTRQLQKYLATVAASPSSPVTANRLESAQMLLEAFGHAITRLNKNATRVTRLLSLHFDYSGLLVSASVQSSLLEKVRVVQRSQGELSFVILYQLLGGCTGKLRSDLHLDVPIKEDEKNVFLTIPVNPKELDWLKQAWTRTSAAMEQLMISEEEAMAIWAILAAIYHLGFAGAVRGAGLHDRGRFSNPIAAQRAASLLGCSQDELQHAVFSLPTGMRRNFSGLTHMSNSAAGDSPSPPGTPTSTPSSVGSFLQMPSAEAALEGFVMGLYEQAFSSLVSLINRALHSSSHHVSTIYILDMPGIQNPGWAGSNEGASFDDLCHNYAQERLHMLFYNTVFLEEQDRYEQENIECNFTTMPQSPLSVISLIDRMGQTSMRSAMSDARGTDNKGLLYILDEEAIFPTATTESFLERLQFHSRSDDIFRGKPLVKVFPKVKAFVLMHCQKTLPVRYNADNWLKRAREHPATRAAIALVSEATKGPIAALTSFRRHQNSMSKRSNSLTPDRLILFKQRPIKRTPGSAGVKRHSVSLQTKFKLDVLMDTLRRTKQTFIFCVLPQNKSSRSASLKRTKDSVMDIPFVRNQLKRVELLNALRIYRQGFPENLPFGDFVWRFNLLAPPEERVTDDSVVNRRETVEKLMQHVDLEKSSYRLGVSKIFFRSGTLTSLDNEKETRFESRLIGFQAQCRGYLMRKTFKSSRGKENAVTVLQRNIRMYLKYKNWSWWKLVTKVMPILDVHRTEEELKQKTAELDDLRSRVGRLEEENTELKESNHSMNQQIQHLSAELSEEHAASGNAHEILESEQVERMRLEQALSDLQSKHDKLQRSYDQLELETEDLRAISHGRVASESEDDLDEKSADVYFEKYRKSRVEFQMARRKWQMETEEEVETVVREKKAIERKLSEALAEVEVLNDHLSSLRLKANRIEGNSADIELQLEGALERNAELEKKQKKFDHELSSTRDRLEAETNELERLEREREGEKSIRYGLERSLEEKDGEIKSLERKLNRLEEELKDASKQGTREESEVLALKQSLREAEQKVEDHEEEMDDLAVEVQQLKSAKTRLEMENQRLEQSSRRELDAKDEEYERQIGQLQKKVKGLEEQIEHEYEEKSAALKAKRSLEFQLVELRDRAQQSDPETERRLRKAVHKMKALLHDNQEMLQFEKERNAVSGGKGVKALRHELDDVQDELEHVNRSKRKLEMELDEKQMQIESLSRDKESAEKRSLELGREKRDLESKLEDDQEAYEELVTKQKSTLQQVTSFQVDVSKANEDVDRLESENLSLKHEVEDLNQRLEQIQRQSVVHSRTSTMEVKELQEKLELEQSAKHRLEVQSRRLKESVRRLTEEKEALGRGDGVQGDVLRRANKQARDLKEELAEAERKEQEANRKWKNMKTEYEGIESNYSSLQKELERANKRIQDLRSALQVSDDDERLDDDDDDDVDGDDSDDSPDDGRIERRKWTPSKSYGAPPVASSRHRQLRTLPEDEESDDGDVGGQHRIADVGDFENITPKTLRRWKEERQPNPNPEHSDDDKPWFESDGSQPGSPKGATFL